MPLFSKQNSANGFKNWHNYRITGGLWLLIFLWTVGNLHAQESLFGAALVGGLNASQIDGDLSAGFNKLGLTGGFVGITNLSEKTEINLELLYSQRGSQNELFGTNADFFDISIDYLEIPVLFKLKDWSYFGADDITYHKVQVHAGLSYSRLISSSIGDGLEEIATDEFKDDNISWIIGGGFHINRHWAFVIRYTRNFGQLQELPDRQFQNYFLTFRMEYRL